MVPFEATTEPVRLDTTVGTDPSLKAIVEPAAGVTLQLPGFVYTTAAVNFEELPSFTARLPVNGVETAIGRNNTIAVASPATNGKVLVYNLPAAPDGTTGQPAPPSLPAGSRWAGLRELGRLPRRWHRDRLHRTRHRWHGDAAASKPPQDRTQIGRAHV